MATKFEKGHRYQDTFDGTIYEVTGRTEKTVTVGANYGTIVSYPSRHKVRTDADGSEYLEIALPKRMSAHIHSTRKHQ